jgi:hypothetical protein
MSDLIPDSNNNSGDPDYNESGSTTNTENVSTETTQESSQTSKGNPAWEEALSSVPPEFHPHLKEHFGKWDGGVQQRFQKVQQQYAPYKELADLNVDPTEINEAMQFRHLLQTQPEEVFKWMQEQYKFGAPVSQGQEDNEENLELDENEAFFKDPRYTEVANKAAFAEQAIQQFNRQSAENQANEAVKAETTQVQEQFPGLDIKDVATYALGISQQTGKIPNLIQAAEAMSKYIPEAPVARVSDSAPPVIGGNKGLPSATPPNYGAMTPDQRSQRFAELMGASQNG